MHLLFKNSCQYLIVQIQMKIGNYIIYLFNCGINIKFPSEGARVWSELQDDTQEVLRPHFNST